MSTRLIASLVFCIVTTGVVLSIVKQQQIKSLPEMKARATILEAKQRRAQLDSWRIFQEHQADYAERERELAQVHWLTPAETEEMTRLEAYISEGEGRVYRPGVTTSPPGTLPP